MCLCDYALHLGPERRQGADAPPRPGRPEYRRRSPCRPNSQIAFARPADGLVHPWITKDPQDDTNRIGMTGCDSGPPADLAAQRVIDLVENPVLLVQGLLAGLVQARLGCIERGLADAADIMVLDAGRGQG